MAFIFTALESPLYIGLGGFEYEYYFKKTMDCKSFSLILLAVTMLAI